MSVEKLEPILEGYLKKQSPKGLLVKPWQERYFVLQPNGEILYYASHQTMSEVTGRIKLRTVTEIGISKKNGCVIEIEALKKGSPRMYSLMANNSSDARMWMESIEDVKKKCEELDKKGAESLQSTMSIIFQCPGPDGETETIIERTIYGTENQYEVKAALFKVAKKLGRPLPATPEDYLVILENPAPESERFFLEDIRGELGQHPSLAAAFKEKQSWRAVVKPLAEMSDLKQQLEKQRSTSQEIEILVGRSASTSSADSVYLSEVIRCQVAFSGSQVRAISRLSPLVQSAGEFGTIAHEIQVSSLLIEESHFQFLSPVLRLDLQSYMRFGLPFLRTRLWSTAQQHVMHKRFLAFVPTVVKFRP